MFTTRNALGITVSGGTPNENEQMVSMIHTFMVNSGFTNVSSPAPRNPENRPDPSLADMLRTYNPELFDTPIRVSGESEEEVQQQEHAAFMSFASPSFGRFDRPMH